MGDSDWYPFRSLSVAGGKGLVKQGFPTEQRPKRPKAGVYGDICARVCACAWRHI
jgi:hypothetical protein